MKKIRTILMAHNKFCAVTYSQELYENKLSRTPIPVAVNPYRIIIRYSYLWGRKLLCTADKNLMPRHEKESNED